MIEECGLCQNVAELRKSHCISSALYKLCTGSMSPLHIVDWTAVVTSYEAKTPFLCDACEDRFSSLGESKLIPLCLKGPGDFPFQDELKRESPSQTWERARLI